MGDCFSPFLFGVVRVSNSVTMDWLAKPRRVVCLVAQVVHARSQSLYQGIPDQMEVIFQLVQGFNCGIDHVFCRKFLHWENTVWTFHQDLLES